MSSLPPLPPPRPAPAGEDDLPSPPQHRNKNSTRRRGKGKGKGLQPPPLPLPPPPPPQPPIPVGWIEPKQIESDIWEDETFKSFVDAADAKSMELLINDLAMALPEISEQIVERKQSDLGGGSFLHPAVEAYSSPMLSSFKTWRRERTTSLDCMYTQVARSVVDDPPPPIFSSSLSRSSSSCSFEGGFALPSALLSPALPSSASLSLSTAAHIPPPPPVFWSPSPPSSPPLAPACAVPWWRAHDPERQVRVALVVEMAEIERKRRREETEHTTWKDRLHVAARIEWAVLRQQHHDEEEEVEEQEKQRRQATLELVLLAEETERARRCDATLPDQVSLSLSDYEVICPYNSLGCDVTLRRSELPAHFDVCVHRAEVQEAKRLAAGNEAYNPLDHIIVCPYTVVGCTHSCRRADLPAHLAQCAQRVETLQQHHQHSDDYEVVCAYATQGCRFTCQLAQLPQHLVHCSFGPARRDAVDELAEREASRRAAISAEEEERSRRLAAAVLFSPPHQQVLLQAIAGTRPPWMLERNAKVLRVKQAAEIEKMRREEERLALLRQQPTEELPPPGRRQIVLEMALRRQKLHHANWFPADTLAFAGRRTHVAPFHNHLEQQTRNLHRMLHDEIERFGRDCALWEIEAKDVVHEMIDNIRIVVESCWQKYVSTAKPTLHIFGSFASELAVPGVSDLDLVVVPGGDDQPLLSSGGDVRQLMKDRLEAARRCTLIGEALSNCPDFLHDVRVIATASVPLVTMRTFPTLCSSSSSTPTPTPRGLDIDLTVALSQHDGVQAAEFVTLLRVRFPPLMPMVRLLKAFLFVRGLANPFLGGLSSYALVLMAAVSVMRSFDRAGKAIFLNQGELIVDFLDLFGREFDCNQDAIICSRDAADKDKMGIRRGEGSKRFLRIGPRRESTCSDIEHVMLVVDDPIRVGNNIGRPCFAFPKVQAAFAEVLASLLSFVVKNETLLPAASSSTGTTLLETVFGVRPMS